MFFYIVLFVLGVILWINARAMFYLIWIVATLTMLIFWTPIGMLLLIIMVFLLHVGYKSI